jgi:hypothetical protein
MRVRYIGSDSELKGCTGWACDNMPQWRVRVDDNRGKNPLDHPRFFGRHDYPETDWEEI